MPLLLPQGQNTALTGQRQTYRDAWMVGYGVRLHDKIGELTQAAALKSVIFAMG